MPNDDEGQRMVEMLRRAGSAIFGFQSAIKVDSQAALDCIEGRIYIFDERQENRQMGSSIEPDNMNSSEVFSQQQEAISVSGPVLESMGVLEQYNIRVMNEGMPMEDHVVLQSGFGEDDDQVQNGRPELPSGSFGNF